MKTIVAILTLLLATAVVAQEPRAELPLETWQFQPGHLGQAPVEADWVPTTLPYLWTQTWLKPKEAATTGWARADLRDLNSGWYATAVDVPADWRGKRVALKLEGVQCDAVVYVGAAKVGELDGPDGRVELTGTVQPGRSAQLRLWVTRWWEGSTEQRADDRLRDLSIKAMARSQWYSDDDGVRKGIPGGISERVTLLALPAAAEITHVVAETSFRAKELRVHLDSRIETPLPGAMWQVQVTELDGSTDGLPSASAPAEAGLQTVTLSWPNPKLWELGGAYLYRLEARLVDRDGHVVDHYPSVRFGFREVWANGRELMLNDHPTRLRLGYFTSTVQQMLLFEGMGFNAIEFQPNPTGWYSVWGMFPHQSAQGGTRELLDAADERGWAVLMPAPGVSHVRDELLKPEVEAEYRRDLQTWLGKLDMQNRPSILMWAPSMNTQGYPGPAHLGRQPTVEQPAWFGKVDSLVHEADPTRLVFHHQGGQTGDVETANLYLNFVPLAEQEEWLSDWSVHGDKPWGAVEHLAPVSLDFWKNGDAWYTEYAAIYLGDRAYAMERDEYLDAVERAKAETNARDPGALAGAFGDNGNAARVGDWTAYYRLMDLFVRGVNRAWRTWGCNVGMFPWLFDVGFGRPPGYEPKFNHWWMYEDLRSSPEQLHQRPDWANPLYDAYHDTMQPLLAYLGGPLPRFTAIEPRYSAGETAERSLNVVWDGPGRKRLDAHWSVDMGGREVAAGDETFDLGPGAIVRRPLRFNVPAVTARTDAAVRLTVDGTPVDEAELTFFPSLPPPPALKSRWGLYDPAGLAGDWAKAGLEAREVSADAVLDDLDVLVIGPRALTSGLLPFDASDVERGLRVLVLEQELAGLERFGFRCQDVMPRYVFPRAPHHPVLAGVTTDDLANWRGAGKLLPTTSEGMRRWPWPHGPHWGNTGAVASVVIETPPSVACFTPLMDCEFDLAYTPLLSLRYGRGEVIWSQLDIMGRIGAEPTADRLARNLVQYLDAPTPEGPLRELVAIGAADQVAALDPERQVGWLSSGPAELGHSAEAFVRRGGTVWVTPNEPTPEKQAELGLPWELPLVATTATRVVPDKMGDDPLLAGIGPQLLHWRRPVSGYTFAAQGLPRGAVRLLDGWLLKVPAGHGQWVLLQLAPALFPATAANRWNGDAEFARLLAQLEANLGAPRGELSADAMVRQMLSRKPLAKMVTVRLWQVQTRDGGPWRLRGADADGKVTVPVGGRVVTYLYSSVPRRATYDSAGGNTSVLLNGTSLPENRVLPQEWKMPLRAGWNRLELPRLTDTPEGWVRFVVSDPGDLRVAPTPEQPDWTPPVAAIPAELAAEPLFRAGLLYEPMSRTDDPYGFSAW